jgi:hypothetical protein
MRLGKRSTLTGNGAAADDTLSCERHAHKVAGANEMLAVPLDVIELSVDFEAVNSVKNVSE